VHPAYWLLSPLIAVVGWARWRVGAHTLLQALAGMLLAGGVAMIVFWLLGIVSLA
jgi:membrane-associated phospholipid phosphatase